MNNTIESVGNQKGPTLSAILPHFPIRNVARLSEIQPVEFNFQTKCYDLVWFECYIVEIGSDHRHSGPCWEYSFNG